MNVELYVGAGEGKVLRSIEVKSTDGARFSKSMAEADIPRICKYGKKEDQPVDDY
jgi:hypothetical protein